MEAHSDHEYYGTEEEYREGDNSLRQSLNGIWRVCYSRNAQERPQAFYREGFDSGSFDECLNISICVPRYVYKHFTILLKLSEECKDFFTKNKNPEPQCTKLPLRIHSV